VVTGTVAEGIVLRFQAVHIDEGEHKWMTGSLRSCRFTLQLHCARVPAVHAREPIDRRDRPILSRHNAVGRRGLPIGIGPGAVTGRSPTIPPSFRPIRSCTRVQTFDAAPLAGSGSVVAARRSTVARLGGHSARLRCPVPCIGEAVSICAGTARSLSITNALTVIPRVNAAHGFMMPYIRRKTFVAVHP